jgi:hypothetical protein
MYVLEIKLFITYVADESQSSPLRLLTAVELFKNAMYYGKVAKPQTQTITKAPFDKDSIFCSMLSFSQHDHL